MFLIYQILDPNSMKKKQLKEIKGEKLYRIDNTNIKEIYTRKKNERGMKNKSDETYTMIFFLLHKRVYVKMIFILYKMLT